MDRTASSLASQRAESTLISLGSSASGLSAREAQRRLGEFGPNRVEAVAGEPLWLLFAREFGHFFALILWLADGLAFFAAYADPGQGLLPQQVEVKRDGATRPVAATELVPGVIVQLAEGARVPADCRVVESWGLRANLATLTGESYARAITAEPAPTASALQAQNLLFAGTLIIAGECTAVVFATGMHTEFGRIAHLTQTAGETESPLQREIRRVSHLVALLALALGLVFFAIGQGIGLHFWANFVFAIGIIVANRSEERRV